MYKFQSYQNYKFVSDLMVVSKCRHYYMIYIFYKEKLYQWLVKT